MVGQSVGSIVVVHGTGVRLKRYQELYQLARSRAASCGLPHEFVPCAWGDPLGVDFRANRSQIRHPKERARARRKRMHVGIGSWETHS